MDTRDFLQRVLPTDGNYCAWVAAGEDGKPKQRFFSSLVDLADFLILLSDNGHNVYYAVSAFGEERTRKSHNVISTKLFAFDIDVGKVANSYATAREAITSLKDYLEKTRLPKPLIVSSGAGLHVYWVLTEAVSPDKWLPVAEALKRSATQAGLIIDPTVTADLSRVLRPVGCMHQGKQQVVKVLLDAEPVEFASIKQVLTGFITPYNTPATKRASKLSQDLKIVDNGPKAEAGIIVNKCKQIHWGVNNQGEVPEPFWYAMMGVAAYTKDPESAALAWSDKHPAFSRDSTLRKLEQWKEQTTGPATCSRFEAARPGGCKGCPLAKNIVTPAQIGAQYEETELAEDAIDPSANEIMLPVPFKRTATGIKMTVDDTDFDVCDFDIYPVGYGYDETLGYEIVRYHWNRRHEGWKELRFRQALLVDGNRDFGTTIADAGIVMPNKRNLELFHIMLRSYMDELRKVRAMTNLYQSMGWKDGNNKFVIGDTIIRTDDNGAVIEESTALTSNSNKNGHELFGTSGTIEDWVDGTEFLELHDMPWHMFALGMGFAAPLFELTGLKGMTVSLYGPTGGGKTLLQNWIQSIYGNPDKLHFAAKFTQNSLFSRLGLYCNLPMTIDEATMFPDKDVGDFLYWVSQGRDKARLTRSAEERDLKTWSTPVILSTNKSIVSKLVSAGGDTDAQLARLMELPIPAHPVLSRDSKAGSDLHAHIFSNYGLVGREYIKELVRLGPVRLTAMIKAARNKFTADYSSSFTGEERFWEQAVILQELGSSIAKRLGLIKYDYTKGTSWVLDQLCTTRQMALENKADAFDLLAEYLTEHADSAVTAMHTGAQTYIDESRVPRGEVRIRYDLYRRAPQEKFTRGTLLVSRVHLRKWLAAAGVDYKNFTKEIENARADATPASGKAYLVKGTNVKAGQVYAMGFNLANPRLEGILNDADDAAEQAAFKKIGVVVPMNGVANDGST